MIHLENTVNWPFTFLYLEHLLKLQHIHILVYVYILLIAKGYAPNFVFMYLAPHPGKRSSTGRSRLRNILERPEPVTQTIYLKIAYYFDNLVSSTRPITPRIGSASYATPSQISRSPSTRGCRYRNQSHMYDYAFTMTF